MTKEKYMDKRNFYNHDDSGKVFLLAMLLPFVISLVFSIIADQISKGQGIELEVITQNIWFAVAFSVSAFLIYLGIYFFYNRKKKIAFSAIKLDFKMKWQNYLLAIGLGIVALFGLQYVVGAFDNLLKVIGFPLENGLTINPTDWGSFIIALVVLGILPAIGEELIFRGIIFSGLRERFNSKYAILLSSLIFALAHTNLQQFIYPFLFGMLLSWVFARSGSLVMPILMHMVNNILVVTFSFIQNMTGFTFALPSTWWFYLVAVALLGVTILITFLIDKFYFKSKNKEDIAYQKDHTSLFFYSSLAVSGVMLIIMTVLQFTM